MNAAQAIAAIRRLMIELELDAWVVPSADPHQSEYVSENWQRRAFASGFDGSAGTLVVLRDRAGLWTDARYHIQAEAQLAPSGIELFKMGSPDVSDWPAWLAGALAAGQRVGVDPWVFSMTGFGELDKALSAAGAALVPVADDLVDRVWGADQPPMPATPLRVHAPELAGERVATKMERLDVALVTHGADALLLSALDDIAWTFNLRGADIAYNPVFVAYALVERGRATLFTELGRVDDAVRAALPAAVALRPYEEIEPALAALGATGSKLWLDPAATSEHLARLAGDAGAEIVRQAGPVREWKAAKNAAEIAGLRAAHVRDGVAMVRFLRWLPGAVAEGGVTELAAERALDGFRARAAELVGASFHTIMGYGAHGAIIHYAATEATNVSLRAEGLLLVDSGGQYLDGTTDITRTLALGEPTSEHRRAYTGVLRGHLALRHAAFLAGTNGYQLDAVARVPLWQHGLHYGHGTGHGVGAHLCVHEGPFSVSARKNLTPLAPGHVLSNEPGYYREGEYGVRIENVVVIEVRETTDHGDVLGFDDLTLCPYDRRLIDLAMLSDRERAQVDAYHERIRETLSPHLDAAERAWLAQETAPL